MVWNVSKFFQRPLFFGRWFNTNSAFVTTPKSSSLFSKWKLFWPVTLFRILSTFKPFAHTKIWLILFNFNYQFVTGSRNIKKKSVKFHTQSVLHKSAVDAKLAADKMKEITIYKGKKLFTISRNYMVDMIWNENSYIKYSFMTN